MIDADEVTVSRRNAVPDTETNAASGLLFNLESDLEEASNLWTEEAQRVRQMQAVLFDIQDGN